MLSDKTRSEQGDFLTEPRIELMEDVGVSLIMGASEDESVTVRDMEPHQVCKKGLISSE